MLILQQCSEAKKRVVKVCHLTSAHPPFDTRIFYKECHTLVKAGYKVVLVAPHDRDEVVDGVFIHAVPKAKGRWQRMTRTVWQVYRAAIVENAQIYHFHDPELLFTGLLLKLAGKVVIYDVHEDVPKDILDKDYLPQILRKPIAIGVHLAERIFTCWLPIVYAENSYGKDYPWIKLHTVVLNMPIVSQLLAIIADKYSQPTVGYIGCVTHDRGSLTTLKMLHILKERGCAIKWECIGPVSAEHTREMMELARRYNLEGINVCGYLKPHIAWVVMARCHVGLVVLQPIPNFIESYPTKIFEYMALGLPVVASNFPLYREVVETEGCGLCVDPQSPDDIARAVQWLVDHPEEAAAMGRRGQVAVRERYNWDTEAKKLLAFYQTLLDEVNETVKNPNSLR